MNKEVSIIITTIGRLSRLAIVLKALENQMNNETEAIVVLDGCDEASVKAVKKIGLNYSPIYLWLKNKQGRSAARNRGIEKSTGRLLIFIDDDRVPCSDFVSSHRTAHSKDCVVIGSRKEVLISENKLNRMAHNDDLMSECHQVLKKANFESGDVIFKKLFFCFPFKSLHCLGFTTGNVSIKRAHLERTGLFNENFKGWGFEDTELGYRLFKNNIKIIRIPSIVNCHLLHDFDLEQRFKEEFKSQLIFFKIIKWDFLLKFVVFLSFSAYPLRIIYWNFLKYLEARKIGKPVVL